MKVFGKWLVVTNIEGKNKMAASFNTKKEAIKSLDLNFKKVGENDWIDKYNRHFHIEKNTKEY